MLILCPNFVQRIDQVFRPELRIPVEQAIILTSTGSLVSHSWKRGTNSPKPVQKNISFISDPFRSRLPGGFGRRRKAHDFNKLVRSSHIDVFYLARLYYLVAPKKRFLSGVDLNQRCSPDEAQNCVDAVAPRLPERRTAKAGRTSSPRCNHPIWNEIYGKEYLK